MTPSSYRTATWSRAWRGWPASGNAVANEELSWFRAADKAAARDWIAVAAGRRDRVDLGTPAPLSTHDFASPLHRWRRNYIFPNVHYSRS